ncbi:hypothetical protein V6N13_073155 [Hibiscus sabdariffa]
MVWADPIVATRSQLDFGLSPCLPNRINHKGLDFSNIGLKSSGPTRQSMMPRNPRVQSLIGSDSNRLGRGHEDGDTQRQQ